jgi:hypothetical protein
VAGPFEHSNEPLGSIKGRKFLDEQTVSFSRGTLLHGVSQSVKPALGKSCLHYTIQSDD